MAWHRAFRLAIMIGVVGVFPAMRASAADASELSAPAGLSMVLPGSTAPLAAGSWTNHTQVQVRFEVPAEPSAVTPQVEFIPLSRSFSGAPNFTGHQLTAPGSAAVTVSGLHDGTRYHWAARVVDAAGNASGWVNFGVTDSSLDLGVDLTPPSRPIIRSPSDPDQNTWYHNANVLLNWAAQDGGSGVSGYTYALLRTARVIPPGSTTAQTAARVSNLGDGTWFLAIRAEDHAGNWSPTATFRVQIDRTPPHITWLSPATFTYDPYNGSASFRFRSNKQASVHISLFRVGAKRPLMTFAYPNLQPGQVNTLTWNGKVNGKIAPKGYYFLFVQAVDHAQNWTRANFGGIRLDPSPPVQSAAGVVLYPDGGKRIIVSLSQEALYAYDGTHLVLKTLVTTGNPSLPTPTGHFTILTRQHPFEFISPWPQGSPYWYAPSWTSYAMLFRQGGYYLHDAPWRSVFGPGSNGPGQPGTNYGGTHGCVNIPLGAMTTLWNWAPLGTSVDVVP